MNRCSTGSPSSRDAARSASTSSATSPSAPAARSVTALVFVFLFGPPIIDHAAAEAGQGPADPRGRPAVASRHQAGTPTMGGLMILSGVVVSTLLWANLSNRLCLGRAVRDARASALIGFYDDYLKVTKQTPRRLFRQARACAIECVIAAGRLRRDLMRSASRRLRRPRWRFRSSRTLVVQSRLVLRRVRRLRHRRRRQCGELDRRPRRARHRAGDDRGGDASA